MSNLTCLKCEGPLNLISKETRSDLKYDYTETTHYYYYKCEDCGKMFDERIKSTGIRHLALNNYDKAENLALQPRN